jgi:16S rRNA (adenine1518-N6/adenine1519-N6)-dimethyltransferase
VLSPVDVRSLLAEHGLHPSRALGQHFLVDPNTARRIARLADVGAGDRVLEIGPGLGSLTLALAATGAEVHALELDRRLLPALESVVADAPGVSVEQGDALEYDFAAGLGAGRPDDRGPDDRGPDDRGPDDRGPDDRGWVCVSNLPYNVATTVVLRLLDEVPLVERLLVMVQREVGERLAAGPGSRIYGAVSVRIAYHAEAHVVGAVPPTVFLPRPKVDSALVRIDRRPAPAVDVGDPDAMFGLVRAGFAQRRKMLRRSLRGVLGDRVEAVLTGAGIDPALRAEALGIEAWAALAREAAS